MWRPKCSTLRPVGAAPLRRIALLALVLALGIGVPARAATPQIKHVWVVVLENESASTTFAANSPAPFLARTLTASGAFVPNYFGIGHASLDNYIAMISGQAPNPMTQGDCQQYTDVFPGAVGSDGQVVGLGCVYAASVKTIADQLSAKGLSWKGYMQDMGNDPSREPATCAHPTLNSSDGTQTATAKDSYAARHDPFVYFHSIIDSPQCGQRVVPLTALQGDLASEATTPAFSFITPSLCEDGHDAPCADGRPGGLASANTFLSTWMPRITASPAFNDGGLVIVTFDESDMSDTASCCGEAAGPSSPMPGITGPGGGKVGAVLLSPYIRPGTASTRSYNHYSLLRSLEDFFGVGKLGMANGSGVTSFGADIFTQPGGPPPGAPPLLQQSVTLVPGSGGSQPGAGGGGGSGKPVVGCRAAKLPKPRKGHRLRRGALIATAKFRHSKGGPTLTFSLTHFARVTIRWHGAAFKRGLKACQLYRLRLPKHAGRVTLSASAGRGIESRRFR
jgi:phosphatidylinositol-3-phosphatase